MKKSSAFTIIELLITIAIFGILAAVAAPSYKEVTLSNAMTTNTNRLIGSLLLARSESIKRGTRVSVCESSTPMEGSPSCQVLGTWENGWVVWEDENNNNVIDGAEEVIQVSDEADGVSVTIRGTASVLNVASFVPTGFPQTIAGDNTSGTFSLCDSRGISDARAVRILASGRIRGTSSVAAVSGGC